MIEREKDFLCVALSILWFRIPQFREKVIELQIYSKDEKLYSNIDKYISNRAYEYHRDKFNRFEWESEFYIYLKNFQKAEDNFEMLDLILKEQGWQDHLKKRGLFMLNFIADWGSYVDEEIIKKSHLNYYEIPGYSHIIKCCLME